MSEPHLAGFHLFMSVWGRISSDNQTSILGSALACRSQGITVRLVVCVNFVYLETVISLESRLAPLLQSMYSGKKIKVLGRKVTFSFLIDWSN